jgi:hypothetical protein
MKRAVVFLAVSFSILSSLAAAAQTPERPRVLVLPLRTIGVSDTTVAATRELLSGALESRGMEIVEPAASGPGAHGGPDACDDAACAAAAAGRHHATAVYGSLSRLGEKIVVRIRALREGDEAPFFSDQISALEEEDLDVVVRRFAHGIASGRSNSDSATLDTITEEETLRPRRRSTRAGLGLRAGFLWPAGASYANADRMTSLRIAYKYETPTFSVEMTPVLGIMWGDGNAEWTILDLAVSRLLGAGDVAGYVIGGIGVHSVHVEEEFTVVDEFGYPYAYESTRSDSETTLTADLGIGLLALRTYDFEIVVDVRFHHVFAEFDGVGGGGADGLLLTFGTSR